MAFKLSAYSHRDIVLLPGVLYFRVYNVSAFKMLLFHLSRRHEGENKFIGAPLKYQRARGGSQDQIGKLNEHSNCGRAVQLNVLQFEIYVI